jgi:plasmid stability protein
MPTLTLKNIPAKLLKELKNQAKEHHRSMQGEVMEILESTVARGSGSSIAEIAARSRREGFSSPAESAAIVRELRDAR